MSYKIWGNKNSPDYLNVMVNYHYYSENRAINWYLPYMPVGSADLGIY